MRDTKGGSCTPYPIRWFVGGLVLGTRACVVGWLPFWFRRFRFMPGLIFAVGLPFIFVYGLVGCWELAITNGSAIEWGLALALTAYSGRGSLERTGDGSTPMHQPSASDSVRRRLV